MKIEPGKQYLLTGSNAETGSFVKALRPGKDGPAGINTWWVELRNGTECEVRVENLHPLPTVM
jgi:hypothetical protein